MARPRGAPFATSPLYSYPFCDPSVSALHILPGNVTSIECKQNEKGYKSHSNLSEIGGFKLFGENLPVDEI